MKHVLHGQTRIPDFFTLLSCFCSQGDKHSVLIQAHWEKGDDLWSRRAECIEQLVQFIPKIFFSGFLHTVLQIDGKVHVLWLSEQNKILHNFASQEYQSRYLEPLQYSVVISSSWEYSVGAVMGFCTSDLPLQGILYGREQCWSCGQRKPPLIWYIKNPIQKVRRDFSGQSWQVPAPWFVFSHKLLFFSSKHSSSKESGLFSPGERMYSWLTNWFYFATARNKNSYWLILKKNNKKKNPNKRTPKQNLQTKHQKNNKKHLVVVSHSASFLCILRPHDTVSLFFFWGKWLHPTFYYDFSLETKGRLAVNGLFADDNLISSHSAINTVNWCITDELSILVSTFKELLS